jgi:hypothetical protein
MSHETADFIRMRDFLYDGNIGVSQIKSVECAKQLLASDIAWPIKLAKIVSRRKGYLTTIGLDCFDSEAVELELCRQYPQIFATAAESSSSQPEDSSHKSIKCETPDVKSEPSDTSVKRKLDAAPIASPTMSSDTESQDLSYEIVSKQMKEIMLKMKNAKMDMLTSDDCKSKSDLSSSTAQKAIAYYFKSTNEGWLLGKVHSKTHGKDRANFNYLCVFDGERRPYNLRHDLYFGCTSVTTRRGALNAQDMSWIIFWKRNSKKRRSSGDYRLPCHKKVSLAPASDVCDDDKGSDGDSDQAAVDEQDPIEDKQDVGYYHGNADQGTEICWEEN